MTRETFEANFASRSKISVYRLRKMGRRVYPCSCGDEMCEGWQSVRPTNYWEDRIFREARAWNRLWMWVVFLFWTIRLVKP